MKLTTKLLTTAAIAMTLIGCGEDGSTPTTEAAAASAKLPTGYTQKAINSQGNGVEGSMGQYTVKLMSNAEQAVEPQRPHKGVVVKYDGQTSSTMAIEEDYIGKSIVAAIYEGGNLVKVSDAVEVTDVPVVIIDVK